MWVTKFNKIPKERMKKIMEVLKNLADRDPTFRFEAGKNFVIVYSNNKHRAHKRGLWLLHKSEPFTGLGYNVYWEKNT